jgi:hypothetical protein
VYWVAKSAFQPSAASCRAVAQRLEGYLGPSRACARTSARTVFDFRYNNRSALGVEDVARSKKAVVGAKGKRLTYRIT